MTLLWQTSVKQGVPAIACHFGRHWSEILQVHYQAVQSTTACALREPGLRHRSWGGCAAFTNAGASSRARSLENSFAPDPSRAGYQ